MLSIKKGKTCAGEMAPLVNVHAAKTHNWSQGLHAGRKGPTLASCPLTPTLMPRSEVPQKNKCIKK